MRIVATKPLPDNAELIELLKNGLSNSYSYELLGVDGQKSILVGKSAFVGAQITVRKGEITIQASPPSLVTGNFLFFFSLIGVDIILGLFFGPKLKKMEIEIGTFLKSKFG